MRRLPLAAIWLVLLAPVAWRGRPPIPSGGNAPVFAVPEGEEVRARQAADSLFLELGAPVDTLLLTDSRELRIVLRPGAYARRPRFEGTTCVSGNAPDRALRRVARAAYALYGRDRGVQRVAVVAGRDSAVTGGWGRRSTCGSTATVYESRAALDSALAKHAG